MTILVLLMMDSYKKKQITDESLPDDIAYMAAYNKTLTDYFKSDEDIGSKRHKLLPNRKKVLSELKRLEYWLKAHRDLLSKSQTVVTITINE